MGILCVNRTDEGSSMADEGQAEALDGTVRGDIRLEDRVDPETEDRLDAGTPTAAELREINKRFARRPLRAEDVYVLPLYISGTGLDSYGTRQHVSSLRNYKADVSQGDNVPVLAHHGGMSFLGGGSHMDPLGRFFAADLIKHAEPAADRAEQRSWLEGESGSRVLLGKYYKDGGYSLLERAYLLRGTSPNGQDIEDTIRRVEGGTLRDTSIQFTLNPVIAPGSTYLCDVCGLGLFDNRCVHIPLMRYEDPEAPDGVVMATAAIMGARQLEGSLVWRGAFPGAFVARAAAQARAGKLGPQDIAYLEACYGARILGSSYHSLGTQGKGGPAIMGTGTDQERQLDAAVEDERPAAAAEDQELAAEAPAEAPAADAVVVDVETALASAPAPARAAEAELELTALGQALDGLRDLAVATALRAVGTQVRSPEDAVRLLGVLATEAVATRRSLIEACVAERVRARGATGWDPQGYRNRLVRYGLAELEDELRDLTGETATTWQRRRLVPSQIQGRDPEGEEAQERQLSPVEIFSMQGG